VLHPIGGRVALVKERQVSGDIFHPVMHLILLGKRPTVHAPDFLIADFFEARHQMATHETAATGDED
jgi:hypothetical protein